MGFESDFGIVSGILCKDMGLNVEGISNEIYKKRGVGIYESRFIAT